MNICLFLFRFMPDGTYLDAGKLGPQKLAKEMNDIIQTPTRFLDFFRWHRYYTFHSAAEDDYHAAVCGFCALLNNDTRRNQRAFYKNMTKWWNEWGLNRAYPTIVQVEEVVNEEPNILMDVFNKLYDYFFTDS